ncbi:endoplasmic reticulum-based factor for assembly of V-ATPase-domain-containing protein [Phaeosphaeria sp. MPI-PUGE-AT-0046c]|nr:endoplasmic reticulum-based factor for assembly of V-ATPase-domain-containing protein [Phaeosphaeria sp. MPI-PUGE-AT-0046c]
MTPAVVRALQRVEVHSPDAYTKLQGPNEPLLADAQPGNPVSHAQLIDLSQLLKQHSSDLHHHNDGEDEIPTTLASLLQNATIYRPPPPPPPAKSAQYTALMARLRAQEEARSYERMLHPPPTRETFSQRFPSAPAAFSLGATAAPLSEDDELTYEEVHRQIILIINILISIVCVAVFIWVAARHWTVGKRLGLSMAGSFGIAIAEVAVYGGYVRKVKEAKRTERRKPEIKEIVKSWVIDKGQETEGMVPVGGKDKDGDGVRFRKGKHR